MQVTVIELQVVFFYNDAKLKGENMDTSTLERLNGYIIQYGLNFAAAIIILIIGRMVAGFIAKLIENALLKTKLDRTLASFTRHLGFYAMMTFVVIAALNKLGVETGSFIAVVGAASLAIGLALQGSLSNFASGVLLIIFHPFKVGDTVETAGAEGEVTEIHIFNTHLITKDNKKVIIPNSKITGDKIIVHLS
jgi:small conductance mechanosensitive channel